MLYDTTCSCTGTRVFEIDSIVMLGLLLLNHLPNSDRLICKGMFWHGAKRL